MSQGLRSEWGRWRAGRGPVMRASQTGGARDSETHRIWFGRHNGKVRNLFCRPGGRVRSSQVGQKHQEGQAGSAWSWCTSPYGGKDQVTEEPSCISGEVVCVAVSGVNANPQMGPNYPDSVKTFWPSYVFKLFAMIVSKTGMQYGYIWSKWCNFCWNAKQCSVANKCQVFKNFQFGFHMP